DRVGDERPYSRQDFWQIDLEDGEKVGQSIFDRREPLHHCPVVQPYPERLEYPDAASDHQEKEERLDQANHYPENADRCARLGSREVGERHKCQRAWRRASQDAWLPC